MRVAPNSTSQSVSVHLASASDGSDFTTAIAATTTIGYRRGDRGALVTITTATLSSPEDAWLENGFIHKTNGDCRVDLPDAAYASGVDRVYLYVSAPGSVQTGGPLVIVLDEAVNTRAVAGDAMALTSSERTTLTAVIWNALTSGMTTVGSIGKKFADWVVGQLAASQPNYAPATAAALTTAQTDLTTLVGRLTSARAGYLDNLNAAGVVASQADVLALNQSASRRIILITVGQYERPESSTVTYTIEARTYDGDGAATNADGTPTLTATGNVSGSLAANLSAASNPATGVYRWTYTVASSATLEQVRFDVSATMSTAFTLSCYTQVCDFVAATYTTADRTKLDAIHAKLPSKSYLTGTTNSDGDVQLDEATGTPANSAGVTSLLAKFTGITLLAEWLGLIAGKQTGNSTARTELRATGAGSGTYDETTDSLQAVRDRGDAAWLTGEGGGGGGGGSGAYVYTITATTDGSTPLVGAAIRLSGGAEALIGTTGAGGTVSFSVDAGTYTLSATASGRTYTPSSLVVTAAGSTTITLTAISIPPAADASQTSAYTTCRDGQGAAAAGAVIEFRFVSKSDDDSYDRTNFSATSNGSGLLTISLPKSATMQARRRPKGDWVQFTTGTDASYELPQALSGYGS